MSEYLQTADVRGKENGKQKEPQKEPKKELSLSELKEKREKLISEYTKKISDVDKQIFSVEKKILENRIAELEAEKKTSLTV